MEKQNEHILQRQVKDAEVQLSTLIFQANQKLDSVERDGKASVMSEELIKNQSK